MSSPRSSDPDGVSPYAPKWARDRDRVTRQWAERQLPLAGGDERVTMVPADSPNFESKRFRPRGSLEPSPVPEPPMREPWQRDRSRSWARVGSGIHAFFGFVLTIIVAALIAFVIVVEWPKMQTFVAKQRSTENLFGARFHGDPSRPLAGSLTTVSEPRPAEAVRSNSAPSSAGRRIAAINPSATAVVGLSSVGLTQSAVATPAPANLAPATSLPANPAPAVVAPPVTNVAPIAASVPITSVKTVPFQPEKPVRPLGRDEIETLLKQGEGFVSVGDFASARLVYGRVWEANDVRGALALAATYDPIVLARIGAKGATPDVAKAREWYVKARDLGSPDAAPRLEALANSTR